MDLQKARLRMLVAKEMGKELEEKLDAAEKMVLKQEGARDGLKRAVPGIADLMKAVDAEFQEHGKIGGFTVEELSGEPLRLMAVAKSWIQKAIGCVDNLATAAEIGIMTYQGKIKGLKESVEVVQRAYEGELKKLTAIEEGIKDGTIVIEDGRLLQKEISRSTPHVVGAAPPPTLKAQRLAEAKAEAEAKAAEEAAKETKPDAPPELSVEAAASSETTKDPKPKNAKPKKPRKKAKTEVADGPDS